MSNWEDVRLGDVADILVGYAFKSSKFSADEGGVRLLRGANIHQGFTDWGQEARWPATEQYEARYQLADGDVVLAMDRPWIEAGLKRARLRNRDLPALLVQRVARLRGTPSASTSFIHHTLATEHFSRFLQSQVTGATVPHISQAQIASYPLKLPPPRVQGAICTVLDAIDEHIANNRRRVEVLEEMARAIYREWFVKFRYPGHEDVPLVDSALGPIPRGWTAGTIGDVVELKYGKALKASARRGGKVAVVSSAGIVGWHDESVVDGPVIVVGRKGNVGSIHWVDTECWPIDTAYYVVTDLPLRFVVEQLRRVEFTNSHAAVPGLSRESAYARPFVVPPARLLSTFETTVDPLGVEASLLSEQSNKLAALRDLLLPKLVTGQIDVSALDLDAVVGDRVA